jgi:hypothetical protein
MRSKKSFPPIPDIRELVLFSSSESLISFTPRCFCADRHGHSPCVGQSEMPVDEAVLAAAWRIPSHG